MKKKNELIDITENPLYHDTWKLLKKYRDMVWSIELSVQHIRSKFEIEYGSSIEEFLDSVYLAGAGKLSNRLVLFCGGIRRRTAWMFWNSFSPIGKLLNL